MIRHRFRTWSLVGILLAAMFCGEAYAVPGYPAGVHIAPRPGNGRVIYLSQKDSDRLGMGNSAFAAGATPSKIVKVGLLLPLTGRNASLGRAMQDAATVALFDKYAHISPQLTTTRVDLITKDTGDTPEQAATAATQAIEAGAALLIGPVFADAAAAVAPIAAEHHISVISFSNNAATAKPGLYAFGFSPEEQTARVIAFAQVRGKTRIAALIPNSPLGAAVLDAANATLNASGGNLVAVAKYLPQGVGIDKALNELVPPDTPAKFDALFLPEGGAALGTILRALDARGIKRPEIQLLGTGIWDDATLIRRANLDGAWLASSPPASTSNFEKRFVANYAYLPPRIASLAYDAVSLAVTLATSDQGFNEIALTAPAGFVGPANGNFRLRANGTVERSLAVLRVVGTDFTVIDPAPKGFTLPAAAR